MGERILSSSHDAGHTVNNESERHLHAFSPEKTTQWIHAVADAATGLIGADSHEAIRRVLERACREVIPFDSFFLLAYDAASHTFAGTSGVYDDVYVAPTVVPAAGTPAERVVETRRSLLLRAGTIRVGRVPSRRERGGVRNLPFARR